MFQPSSEQHSQDRNATYEPRRCCQEHDHCYDHIIATGGCHPSWWSHYHYEKLSSGGIACAQAKDLSKRNAIQFGNVIKEYTGRNALDYNNYGCYCGFGGSGTPIDGIDRCCQEHDHCYDHIIATGGCHPSWWSHYHYEKLSSGGIACVRQGNDDYCDLQTCECDKQAGACFASHHYIPAHKSYDKSKC